MTGVDLTRLSLMTSQCLPLQTVNSDCVCVCVYYHNKYVNHLVVDDVRLFSICIGVSMSSLTTPERYFLVNRVVIQPE